MTEWDVTWQSKLLLLLGCLCLAIPGLRYAPGLGRRVQVSVATASVFFAGAAYTWYRTPESGVLLPDSVPAPDWASRRTRGARASDAPKVLLGPNVLSASNFPLTVLTFRNETVTDNALTLEYAPDGSLLVSATIRRPDSRDVVASIVNNRWVPLGRSGTPIWSKDQHRLTVLDDAGDTVLHVHFMNPTTVQVAGTFAHPGFPTVVIDESNMSVGLLDVRNNFYENFGFVIEPDGGFSEEYTR